MIEIGRIGIGVPEGAPLDERGLIQVPASLVPSFRFLTARQNGVLNNFLIETWGGVGDYVCAEPAMRYAFENFKGVELSLASRCPELFQHLPFKEVFDLRQRMPNYADYFSFRTLHGADQSLQGEFIAHFQTQVVDYHSLNMWRCQMPIENRAVYLEPSLEDCKAVAQIMGSKRSYVVIHPGRTWQSRTMPKDWWDLVISALIAQGKTVVVIGADALVNADTGTVDVNAEGCIDLRNKLKVMESVALMQNARVVLTNDSAPLHMAVSGSAWVGFVSTVKHPDLLTHWRETNKEDLEWGWRMKNFSRGGMWQIVNGGPHNIEDIVLHTVPDEVLRSWLPDPLEVAMWTATKM